MNFCAFQNLVPMSIYVSFILNIDCEFVSLLLKYVSFSTFSDIHKSIYSSFLTEKRLHGHLIINGAHNSVIGRMFWYKQGRVSP